MVDLTIENDIEGGIRGRQAGRGCIEIRDRGRERGERMN